MNKHVQDKLHAYFDTHKTETYKKGSVITAAHQEPAGISLLIRGVVEQYDITPDGNKITVNVFKPPAFFPMSWAINKTPNIYFFTALTDVKLKQADAQSTVAFLKENPDVMFDLLSRVYKGTDALLRRLVMSARGVAANRLMLELLLEAYRFGEETEKDTWHVEIKQSVLATRSGLARETVSREMHKLVRAKLVTLTKQGFIVHAKRLEQKIDLAH